ncbi:MAG: tRNA-dihydrouridine synthase family protein [Verrucomicrobiales bacterium]|nr:tRNA-dihydrouridine synthase family protein [Verrucomicrobiales bacterium]
MTDASPCSEPAAIFRAQLQREEPLLALAPMQAITDWDFIRLQRHYGGADVCFIEYFRVTKDSTLDRDLVRCFTENPTDKPTVAQMIGNDIDAMCRTIAELQRLPVAAIDLNLGCPAPRVFNKCAGGGLLRDLPRVDRILGALRQAITEVPFTVKTRVGVENTAEFPAILEVLARHELDLVTIHGRTVREMYRSAVHYDQIARAVQTLPCPVLANGSIDSAEIAQQVAARTGVRGFMLGRSAIRNPWLFEQIRQTFRGGSAPRPTGRDVLAYLHALYDAMTHDHFAEIDRVHRVKKFMNFIGAGLPDGEAFLHPVRRATTREALLTPAVAFLDHDEPLDLVPIAEAN